MLELKEITKQFNAGTEDARTALDHVSLHVDEGEFITIVGSNGAGKSTLFNALSGSVLCDAGKIFLDGENITFQPVHQRSRKIGRLFQDPLLGTAPHLTIAENLALAYRRSGKKSSPFSRITNTDRNIFCDYLSRLNMGLEDRLETQVGTLSGGQRQALTLLMATIVTPKLLLLDEHTAALDPGAAEKIMELTRHITAENNVTCLMITHNLSQALSIGNRTLMMEAGKIVLDLSGKTRAESTAEDLVRMFRETSGHRFDHDRALLRAE